MNVQVGTSFTPRSFGKSDVDPESVGNERYRSHGSGDTTTEEDLAPGHIVVSAAVMLGFSLIHEHTEPA